MRNVVSEAANQKSIRVFSLHSKWPHEETIRNCMKYILWLMHCATSREVTSSRPYDLNDFFFSIYLVLLASLGPEVYSASNRNEYQNQKIMFLRSKARPVRRAKSLTGICEPIG
jgi:hypothetical protein